MRRLRLIGAMAAPRALHGPVRPPAGLQQVMNALLPVLGRIVGMERIPRTARVRKDQHPLVAGLECLRVHLIRRRPAFLLLHGELAVLPALAHETPSAPGHLRYLLRPEGVDDLVYRVAGYADRLQRLDQRLALSHHRLVENRLALAIGHRPG